MARLKKSIEKHGSAPARGIDFPRLIHRSKADYQDQHRTDCLIDDQIYIVHNMLTRTNCRNFMSFLLNTIAPIMTKPVPPRRGEAMRTNERFSSYDPNFAQSLFVDTNIDMMVRELGLEKEGSRTIAGLNPNIRIYRYVEGMKGMKSYVAGLNSLYRFILWTTFR